MLHCQQTIAFDHIYPHTLTSTLTTFAVDCQLVKGESEGVRVRKEKKYFYYIAT